MDPLHMNEVGIEVALSYFVGCPFNYQEMHSFLAFIFACQHGDPWGRGWKARHRAGK